MPTLPRLVLTSRVSLPRWAASFVAFPIGGAAALGIIDRLDGPATGLVGGLVAGAALGVAQWLALRDGGLRWVALTAVALAVGTAAGAALNGADTDLAALLILGAVQGAGVGAAQGRALGGRRGWRWAAVQLVAWPLGWLVTTAAGVSVEDGFVVFGATGALAFVGVTGLALRALQGPGR